MASDTTHQADLLSAYGESIDSASKRNRAIVLTLVVACVLGGAGFLNSFEWGWMRQRVRTAIAEATYIDRTLGLKEAVDANAKLQGSRQEDVTKENDCQEDVRQLEKLKEDRKKQASAKANAKNLDNSKSAAKKPNGVKPNVTNPGNAKERSKKNAASPPSETQGNPKKEPDEQKPSKNERAREAFLTNIIKEYVDHSFTIRVPFFGVTFDVNDLGLLVGIGLIIILLMLLYGLKGERRALEIGFEYARTRHMADEFYRIHAGRQVLTTPRLSNVENYTQSMLTDYAPRFFIQLFPMCVYTMIAVNDYLTTDIGNRISSTHTKMVLAYTAALWMAIAFMTWNCWREWLAIDQIWDSHVPPNKTPTSEAATTT